MAKSSGIGDNLYVNGYDLSGDVGAVDSIEATSSLLEVTGIDKGAVERILGLFDGRIQFSHFWNVATDQEHDALAAKNSGADSIVCWFRGSAIGNAAAGLVAKQTSFNWNRGSDGALGGQSEFLGNGRGLEYCVQLTAGQRTDTGATNGSSLDNGDASATGLAAYLQVFSFTGTDATVKLQESSDDGGSDAYADVSGGAFTEITDGPTAERIVTALDQAVEEYLRVVTTTSSGFSELIFAVCVTREPVEA